MWENITENAERILDRVAQAERVCGLSKGSVTLIAASKQNGYEAVRSAFRGGIRNFGENRVQEMEEKLKANAYEGASLHFIGHLQKNKAKNVVGKAELIHSVDTPELLRLISKIAGNLGITQRVLLEVNIGGEQSKSGISPERVPELLDVAETLPYVRVEGLMAIPPAGDVKKTKYYFEKMYKIYVDIRAKKYDNSIMRILSMGMSADFEEAIMSGANTVRVGTAIFGTRTYNNG